MSRIGLLGGTFNPIHYGHLRLAQEMADALQLDQVRLIPSAHPPHRPPPAANSEQRVAMVELAIAGNPRLMVDTREVQRSGYSYTIDTLISLRQELGDKVGLYWLLGSDAWLGLPSWHRWQELLAYCHLVIAQRPGAQPEPAAALQLLLHAHQTDNRLQLFQQPYGLIYRHDITALAISATHIRDTLAQGDSAQYLLPDAVLEYIHDQRLYTDSTSAFKQNGE